MGDRRVEAAGVEIETRDTASYRRVEAAGVEIETRDTTSYRRVAAIGLMVELRSRLELIPYQIVDDYPPLPLTAEELDFEFTAASILYMLGLCFSLSGNEILIAHNTHVSLARTVTVYSRFDFYNRTGDILTYSIEAGEYAVFPQFQPDGWRQLDGKLYFAASAADVEFVVLRLAD